MSDSITVHELEFAIRLGCSKEERAFPQKVRFDLELFLDFQRCLQSDDVSDSENYLPIVRDLETYTRDGEWKLIEKLAFDVGQRILERAPKLEAVCVCARKNILVGASGFSARVTCRRAGAS